MRRLACCSLGALLLALLAAPQDARAFTGRHLGHGLVEVAAGATVGAGEGGTPAAGAQGALTLGIGGKWQGSPARWFLIGTVDRSSWGATSLDRFGASAVRRSATTLAAGLRGVFPLWSRRWRAIAQLQLGPSLVDAVGRREGVTPVHTEDLSTTLLAGTGLQLRLLPRLSVGLNLNRAWSLDDGADLAASVAGLGDEGLGRGRLALGLTITGHL